MFARQQEDYESELDVPALFSGWLGRVSCLWDGPRVCELSGAPNLRLLTKVSFAKVLSDAVADGTHDV